MTVDAATRAAALVSSGPLHLFFRLRPHRVRIIGDGEQLLDAELVSGETRRFSAVEGFEVTASDSSALLLELNGQAMPPVGARHSSGTMLSSQRNVRQADVGNTQP